MKQIVSVNIFFSLTVNQLLTSASKYKYICAFK